MKKVFLSLAAVICLLAVVSCDQKTIQEAETTQEATPKENMPNTTVMDSTGTPLSQDTTTNTAAGDQLPGTKK